MGCDIHLVIERLDDEGQWVQLGQPWLPYPARPEERHYEVFGVLSGVRSDMGPPVLTRESAAPIGWGHYSWGWEEDPSEDIRYCDGYDVDLHSYGYGLASDVLAALIDRGLGDSGLALYLLTLDEPARYRLCVAYDN